MLHEKVEERDRSGYRATRNERLVLSKCPGLGPNPRTRYGLSRFRDSAIPRKRAKKRKGLIQSGWLVSCCRLVGLAVKMDEAARYEILSKRSSGH